MTWIANVTETGSGTIWYRFRSRAPFGEFETIRDFSPSPVLDFAAVDHEGVYEIEVTARNLDTGEIASTLNSFEFLPRVTSEPLVNATAHPHVFLFSAPACREGAVMVVEFRTGSEPATTTSPKRCDGALTMNFLLGGLRAQTEYRARSIVLSNSGQIRGRDLFFQTESISDLQVPSTVTSSTPLPTVSPVLLTSDGVATDLRGNQIWFNPSGLSNITRPDAGGFFWGYVEEASYDISYQVIRKFDLLGQTIRETNAARVNEQLASLGKRTISAFHHEVRPIGGGRVMALASVERLMSDTQGPGDVNILGDMIIVFDDDMNVIWTWDAFDWLDISRVAILDEKCTPTTGGCPPFYLTPTANDWTHCNSVQLTPDGNLLLSVRHQDWLLKIEFADGQGDGHIMWRLGKEGDFRLEGSDPNLWFSHQHDANFERADSTRLVVFDNGNTRVAQTGAANSRGQVWKLDENSLTATPALNADLGVYAVAVGSAELLPNGNYHFHAGYVFSGANQSAHSLEVNRAGATVYSLQADRLIYRSFRLHDLYSVE